MAEEKYNEEKMETTGLEVAVIGMAGRFPGARNIGEFWNNLKSGVESISFFSVEELQEAGCDPELVRHPNYVKVKGILQDVEYFDASFFGYTSKEVGVMDPQMRIFHECVWEALEDAGYNPESYTGRIGLYSGASSGFYWEVLTLLTGIGEGIDPFAIVDLKNKDFISTRISYKLNLKGPAFTVNTACSTSLLAIHLAVQGLLNGECEIALAGGVGVSLPSKTGYLYKEGMIKSPDGHCRAFAARAKGIVGGEGAGVVVLKSLEEAAENGDHIYAVIKGSAINNDGIRKAGFHAPSIEGQAEVISAALYTAEVEPGSIGYIETHGTGTELGDTVEIEALKLAFDMGSGIDKEKRNFCAIGSVKTNIGHLDAAAGVAGFIKTVLVLMHRIIPPSLHFETPNPKIDFENSPFFVNAGLLQWKSNGYPLRAGVSSFGIGGTNAHVVLEEWPEEARARTQGAGRRYQLILLSAKTPSALDKMTENLANYLKQNQTNIENPGHPLNLENLGYTLQVGRKRFQHRTMLVCTTAHDFIDEFTSPVRENVQTFYSNQDDPPVVFMFPGQGSQYINMGLELYKTETVFRKEMDCCFDILKSLMNDDIKEILYPRGTRNRDEEHPAINQTEITQPVIFAFEYALAKLLMKWGIKPYAMIGHSIGEFTAACLSGVFSLEDALKLVVLRGKLMQQMPAGSMVSVPLSENVLNPLLQSKIELSLAAVNSSSLCVISGPTESVDALGIELERKGHRYRQLHTSHAFHSKMMEPILNLFESEVDRVSLSRPEIPYISNVTGDWITLEETEDPGYWSRHLRNTVRFADGIEKLLKKDNLVFVEVGPGETLGSFVRQHKDIKPSQMIVNLVRHPKEEASDIEVLSGSIGRLWLFGVKPDWSEFHGGEKRYRLSLPTYPFEGQRFRIPGSLLDILLRNSAPCESRDLTVLMEQLSKREPLEAASPEETGIETVASPQGLYQRPPLSKAYTAPNPGDEIEQHLARIWQDFFSIKEVGINDDFFELGGDSLKAMIMLSSIHKKLNVEIPLAEFFRKPTVKALARYIKNAEPGKYFSIEPGEDKEYFPLPSAQKRLYFLQQMAPGSTGYNMPLVLSGGKHLDKDKLESTLTQLIARHESLRTSFLEVNNVPVQRIHEDVDFEIEYFDLAAKDREDIIKNFVRPFDLSRTPLLRLGLMEIAKNRYILLFDMHHIIADGTSQAIMANQFMSLYAGAGLPPLKLQYKDYCQWQRKNRGNENSAFKKQQNYWLKQYEGDIPLLNLPVDYPRPGVQDFEGSTLLFAIDKKITAKINHMVSETGATLFMVLLTALNILLAKYTKQEDIIVGSVSAGRQHPDLGEVIGMFVNTLAIRNSPAGEKNIKKFLKEVKNNSLKAFENQDYPFEELVEKLGVNRSINRNPLFDIMLVLQNFDIPQADEGKNNIPTLEHFHVFEGKTSRFDLSIYAEEKEEKIAFIFEYSTKLFKQETIERLFGDFTRILEMITGNIDIKIKDIRLESKLATLKNVFPDVDFNL